MATVLELLNEPEFTDARLTETINIPPAVTGRLAQIGLFRDTPIATTYAKIALREQTITIIPSRERGGPANFNMGGRRSEVLIPIPHFPLDDAITPSDLQNLMVYGESAVLQMLGAVLAEKLLGMRAKHDATHAHLDWGALNGLVLDAENVQLLDTYAEFGLVRPTFSFDLEAASTDVAARNRALKARMQPALAGSPSTGVRLFCSPEFFDRYVGHANVLEAYRYYSGRANPARDDIVDEFYHAGVTLERVSEEFAIRQPDGSFVTRPAIPAGEAIGVPLGTDLFRRYIAPPDTIFDANQAPSIGARVHVSTEDRPHGKGRDIHTESNVLPICTRPGAMFRITPEASAA